MSFPASIASPNVLSIVVGARSGLMIRTTVVAPAGVVGLLNTCTSPEKSTVYSLLLTASRLMRKKFTARFPLPVLMVAAIVRVGATLPLAWLIPSKMKVLPWVATYRRSAAASSAMLGMLKMSPTPAPKPVAGPLTTRSMVKVDPTVGAAFIIETIAWLPPSVMKSLLPGGPLLPPPPPPQLVSASRASASPMRLTRSKVSGLMIPPFLAVLSLLPGSGPRAAHGTARLRRNLTRTEGEVKARKCGLLRGIPSQTGELAIFGVAHILFQQRVAALGGDCEGPGTIRLCETECTELGSDIGWNWRRIAFRVCGALQLPQPVKIVGSQVRVHNRLRSYALVAGLVDQKSTGGPCQVSSRGRARA